MKKNVLVGLSGGPSVAINASLAGIISEVKMSNYYDNIFGARNGIEGVLDENLIDLSNYSDQESINLLKQTPAMAIGSCRHKVKVEEFESIKNVLIKNEIKTFFYIGGNDSMDTVLKLSKYFKDNNVDINVLGVPKTIDNDLPITDHTPGFGSSAKYLYHTISEINRDSEIYPVKNVVIVEIMGRNSGWLTLAAGLPHFLDNDVLPQIVAIPEVTFDENKFLDNVKHLMKTKDTVVCVVSEGIKTQNGDYVGMSTKTGKTDTFGHKYLSGVGKYLEMLVTEKIGCKVRSIELNVMQRCSSHLASKCDIDEAFSVGEYAVKNGELNRTGEMMVIKRVSDNPYKVELDHADVSLVANLEKDVPEKWFDLEDKQVQKEICEYMLPLIRGDIDYIKDETGLNCYLNIK